MTEFQAFLTQVWQQPAGRLIIVAVLAYIIYRLRGKIAARFVQSMALRGTRRITRERQRTMHSLVVSAVSLVVIIGLALFSLGLFLDIDTVFWVIGLFSAGIGFGFMPFVRDTISGATYIFADLFILGDKVNVLDIEGHVEKVNLFHLHLRGTNGELVIIPNGEIRVIRNYSRGEYSIATVRVKVAATDLERALTLLREIAPAEAEHFPDLLGPWRVISETGQLGHTTELTLAAKARFGRGADLRPRILARVSDALQAAGIDVLD